MFPSSPKLLFQIYKFWGYLSGVAPINQDKWLFNLDYCFGLRGINKRTIGLKSFVAQ
jgi:hypothetical protein